MFYIITASHARTTERLRYLTLCIDSVQQIAPQAQHWVSVNIDPSV